MNMDEPLYAPVTVEVSSDNLNWNPVWINDAGDNFKGIIHDSEWTIVEHDITQYVGNQSAVYIRWGYTIYGSAGAYPESGWNIDDIQLWGSQN